MLNEMFDDGPHPLHLPPAPDIVAPRDGRKILFTKDFHFIARTLETWSDELPTLWEFQTIQATTAAYFFEDLAGLFRHPLSGEPVQPPAGVGAGECFSDRKSLFSHLTNDFFYLRCLLTQRCRTDLTLSYRGQPLLHAGEPLEHALDALNSQVARPVDVDDDPVLDHLEELCFTPNADGGGSEDRDGPFVCPLDGPVIPVKIGITTPMWTWKAWCGSSWEIYACPACLGELGSGHLAEE